MREIPQVLRDCYPCAPGCIPARPWWRVGDGHSRNGGPRRVRSDGVEIHENDYEAFCVTLTDRAGSALAASASDIDALMARIDREHPIPHPGRRAGQVWGNAQGRAVVLLTGETGLFAPQQYPFLLADPCCPWLAPWAPPEAP